MEGRANGCSAGSVPHSDAASYGSSAELTWLMTRCCWSGRVVTLGNEHSQELGASRSLHCNTADSSMRSPEVRTCEELMNIIFITYSVIPTHACIDLVAWWMSKSQQAFWSCWNLYLMERETYPKKRWMISLKHKVQESLNEVFGFVQRLLQSLFDRTGGCYVVIMKIPFYVGPQIFVFSDSAGTLHNQWPRKGITD